MLCGTPPCQPERPTCTSLRLEEGIHRIYGRLPNDKVDIWGLCVFLRGQHGCEADAVDNAQMYPRAIESVLESFYMDDGLTGVDSMEEVVHLQRQLHRQFSGVGFTLRKWKVNKRDFLGHVAQEL